jgi:glycosyltransferase involved in cell wall biosynthesis
LRDHIRGLRETLAGIRGHADREELIDLLENLLDGWEREREESARRMARLTQNLQTLDARLLKVENSRIFRLLQRTGHYVGAWRSKGRRYVPSRHADDDQRQQYQLWLEWEQLAQPGDEWYRRAAEGFAYQPRFSILMHVHRPRKEALSASIEGLQRQLYPDWELCVVDDASPETWVAKYFESLAASGARVQYLRSEHFMGAASSLNRAGMLGSGEYLASIGQHDVLTPHALFYLAEAVQRERFDLLYTDGDELEALNGGGRNRVRPCFRPSWSPDLLTSSKYPGSFFAISRTAFNSAGGFRTEAGAALHFDFALRMAEQAATVRHVPRVLVSVEQTQTAPAEEKRVLSEAIERRQWQATVEDCPGGGFVVKRKLSSTPLASIVICSRNPKLLASLLRTVDDRTSYPLREIVVVQHKTGDDVTMERLLSQSRCVRSPYTGAFDFAAMNNQGARAANGDVLIFLNDDVAPLSADWLTELLAQAQRPEVGVVGALLLYPTGTIQHAGIAIGMMDGAGHPHRGAFGEGFWPWSRITRNVTAVTGACLTIRRRVFEELGGFDASFPINYNDVDLCMRARQAGYQVIVETAAVLKHQESKTRVPGVSWRERELFFDRWGTLIEEGDPYYSPHLTRSKEDCSLGQP